MNIDSVKRTISNNTEANSMTDIDEIEAKHKAFKGACEDPYCTRIGCQVCEMLAIESALIAKVRELEKELSSITKGVRIKIPTETMEYEIQSAIKRATAQLQKDKAGLIAVMESITGEAAFEGLPETKQAAINNAIEQHGGE
jgi:DNA integrity scanning protein DisA with diadenylate cyclase activity